MNPRNLRTNLKTHRARFARRARRVRAKIKGTQQRPRLSVFRSHKYIAAQVIDDERGVTLVSASELDKDAPQQGPKLVRAAAIGTILSKKAKKKGIETVAFDRGPYKFHGRIKALADAARKEGLKF